MKIRVYYEDTDLGGIVYHANYLKFCERARSEVFFQNSLSPCFEGGEFVVLNLEASFKSTAKLGETLDVGTELLNISRSFLLLRQCVYKEERLVFDMSIKLGFLKEGKIARLSETSQVRLQEIFNGS